MTPDVFDSSQQTDHSEAAPHKEEHQKKRRHVNEYSEVIRQETPSGSFLAAFAPKPIETFFDSQLREEYVILLLRQHPITLISKVAMIFAALFLPLLFANTPLLDFLPARFHFAFLVGWFLAIIGFTLETFLVWFFNVYIITDERIIDVDFTSMIYKNVSSAKLDNIEDVTTTTSGFMASVVNYGTIKIQTAAEKREFEFDGVPQPSKVASLLNELLLEEEREKIEGRVN
ncbi:MAG: hypothetical protein ACOZAN_02310 [Patescibacteria group bacterium]